MKKLIPLLYLLLFNMIASAQENEQFDYQALIKQKSVYLELGGAAGGASVSYDVTYLRSNKPKYNLGIGAGVLPFPKWDADSGYVPIPVIITQANLLTGKEKHFLETGVSLIYIVPGIRIGYRYQPTEGGLLFRAALTTIAYIPWVGVSIW